MKFLLQLFGGRGAGSGRYSYYLPKNPWKSKRFKDVTHPRQRESSNSRTFIDESTGLKIRFDIGDPTKNGWKAEDHYHVYNPNSNSWHDFYLDKNGQPCADGSKESHLTPGEYENFLRGIEK